MHKKRTSTLLKLLVSTAAAGLILMGVSCRTGGTAKIEETPGGVIGAKTITGTQETVKTLVYVEVNDHNPLNAGSYVLEDGTYLFDYVVLFAANIRNRDCAEAGEGCTESGPHVHFNPNIRHILENRDTYIKPLQDKGIKVLLGLLGDHDGIGFATMTDEEREIFVADVKKDVEAYGLDGVDFDDEWASKEDWDNWQDDYGTIAPDSIWVYPSSSWSWPTSTTVYRNPAMGIEAGNGTLTAPSDEELTQMWKESGENYFKTIEATRKALGPDTIIGFYEYNSGRYITAEGEANGNATTAKLEAAIDIAVQPWYGKYLDTSANGLSRSIYAPFGMDLGGNAYAQGDASLPPIAVAGDENARDTIRDYAARFKQAADAGAAYTMLFFYNLNPSDHLLKRESADEVPSVAQHEYISIFTDLVFGQKCVLNTEGGSYQKDW
ncbi:MAG: hypothetical protein LBD74_02165 [Spirochaetaceae bacterium]|jgi:hypothetical protein|nr:hypothetical protein [Spirochaetaceae bacterium]